MMWWSRTSAQAQCADAIRNQTIQLFDNPSRSAIARATSLEWEIFYDWLFVEVVDELIELDDEGT